MLISLDQIIYYLSLFGINLDILYLTSFQQSIIFILGNLLLILFMLFWLVLIWKVFSRLVNNLF